jgi:hypothetical protein
MKVAVPKPRKREGLSDDLDELGESLRRHPWTTLAALKGDARILDKIDEAAQLLKDLRRALSE